MKKYVLLLISIFTLLEVKSQTSAQLDANNINATVNTIYKSLFNSNAWAGFEAPKGSGKNTVYASNLWIGGIDANSQLHLAGGTYITNHDFMPGPIMDSTQYASQISQWNRVWKIERYDILNHINNYNQSWYTIPQVFLDWPAHGNVSLGQAADLAPYYDYNNNGIYDPTNGDYPLVPGDQCIYFIFNDDTIHAETGGEKMKIEVHAFVYSFNCPSDSALMNTVFVKYKIINRSLNDYYNTAFGQFTDIDLGGAIDDFVGCDLQRGAYYGYNGDNYDESFNGGIGYDSLLSSQAIVFLGGPVKDDDGIDNPLTTNIQDAIDSLGIPYQALGLNYGDGVIDNERLGMTGFIYYNIPGVGNPTTQGPINASQYYLYLNKKWLDGTNMVHGANGHISGGGTIPTSYIFPGNSDPLNWSTNGISVPVWDEVSAGNQPNDRRGLGITGDFTFESGTTEEIDLAYVFARDYQTINSAQAPVAIMNSRIDDIRNYFIAQQTPCYTFYTYAGVNEINENISFSLYPNPSSKEFSIYYEGENQKLNYSIHDILGKEITSGKINSSQTTIDCSNWSKGIYLVKVGNEKGMKIEKLIIE